MAYCPECGGEIDDPKFCPECGVNLDQTDESTGANAMAESVVPESFGRSRVAVLIGAGLVIIGSFLPWVVVSALGQSQSLSGLDVDGAFTLFFVLGIVIWVLLKWDRWNQAFDFFGGLAIAGLATWYIVDPLVGFNSQFIAEYGRATLVEFTSAGIGVEFTLLGGLLIAGGAGHALWQSFFD